jgi:hypothetical protein
VNVNNNQIKTNVTNWQFTDLSISVVQLKKNIAIKETAANKIVKSNYSHQKVELLQKKHDENWDLPCSKVTH